MYENIALSKKKPRDVPESVDLKRILRSDGRVALEFLQTVLVQ